MSRPPPSSILITGASSGLGAALAREYARPGAALFLSGRDGGRLEKTAQSCRGIGARVAVKVLDVTRRDDMAAWIAACDAERPLELVIANAGISTGNPELGESEAQSRAILATNIDGVANTVWPAIAAMRPRRQGQIALLASLAGFRGMPAAPSYCASKAMVRVWGEALRGWLAADNIRVNVICPGFVESAITARNKFPMPFLMPADRAARIMARGLARNRGRIGYPLPMAFAAWLAAALPDGLMDKIARLTPSKG